LIITIAEIGQAHNGKIETVHAYIDAVATTSVDAIKFQTHIAEAFDKLYDLDNWYLQMNRKIEEAKLNHSN